jgi:RNA-directed DNA polymerase
MKRIGNLYNKIKDVENLRVAAKKAARGKRLQPGVIDFNRNSEWYILNLNSVLTNRLYKTSEYTVFSCYLLAAAQRIKKRNIKIWQLRVMIQILERLG